MADTYEHLLAAELGVSKETVRTLRGKLEPNEWREEHGRGIVLSDSAQKKIRAALAAPLPELPLPGAPGAGDAAEALPERADFVLVAPCHNPRLWYARKLPAAESGEPVPVRICRRQVAAPRRGWYLKGCTWNAERGGWDFDGRATRHYQA